MMSPPGSVHQSACAPAVAWAAWGAESDSEADAHDVQVGKDIKREATRDRRPRHILALRRATAPEKDDDVDASAQEERRSFFGLVPEQPRDGRRRARAPPELLPGVGPGEYDKSPGAVFARGPVKAWAETEASHDSGAGRSRSLSDQSEARGKDRHIRKRATRVMRKFLGYVAPLP